MNVVFSERAIADIVQIYSRISAANPSAAQRVEETIRATCERLGHFPFASARTDEPGMRRIPVVRYPYTIFFRINDLDGIVEIARIVHGSRVKSLTRPPD